MTGNIHVFPLFIVHHSGSIRGFHDKFMSKPDDKVVEGDTFSIPIAANNKDFYFL